jgi:hypothetical protein
MRAPWVALCVLLLGLLLIVVVPSSSDEMLLKYDDDMVDGPQSFGGSGHVIRFDAPVDGGWFVDRVDVCASQYGGGYDPATTLCRVYICDMNMKSLGEAQAPYQVFPYGREQKWGQIEVPFVPVSGPFIVIVAPGSLANRGLFVGYDSTGKTEANMHSGVGSVGQAAKPPKQPLDWMIRAHITTDKGGPAEEGPPSTVLKWDDDTADDKQSFGGSAGMIVRFEPPAGNWVVDAVDLFGGVYGTGQGGDRTAFTLAICDEKMKPIGYAMYPYALFTSDMHWVKVDLLPDVPVTGPFHVLYAGNCLANDGIFLGIDTTRGAGKSFLGRPGQIAGWDFRLPQNTMNWMIRAELKPAK